MWMWWNVFHKVWSEAQFLLMIPALPSFTVLTQTGGLSVLLEIWGPQGITQIFSDDPSYKPPSCHTMTDSWPMKDYKSRLQLSSTVTSCWPEEYDHKYQQLKKVFMHWAQPLRDSEELRYPGVSSREETPRLTQNPLKRWHFLVCPGNTSAPSLRSCWKWPGRFTNKSLKD